MMPYNAENLLRLRTAIIGQCRAHFGVPNATGLFLDLGTEKTEMSLPSFRMTGIYMIWIRMTNEMIVPRIKAMTTTLTTTATSYGHNLCLILLREVRVAGFKEMYVRDAMRLPDMVFGHGIFWSRFRIYSNVKREVEVDSSNDKFKTDVNVLRVWELTQSKQMQWSVTPEKCDIPRKLVILSDPL
jgi:hypothetical protein